MFSNMSRDREKTSSQEVAWFLSRPNEQGSTSGTFFYADAHNMAFLSYSRVTKKIVINSYSAACQTRSCHNRHIMSKP